MVRRYSTKGSLLGQGFPYSFCSRTGCPSRDGSNFILVDLACNKARMSRRVSKKNPSAIVHRAAELGGTSCYFKVDLVWRQILLSLRSCFLLRGPLISIVKERLGQQHQVEAFLVAPRARSHGLSFGASSRSR